MSLLVGLILGGVAVAVVLFAWPKSRDWIFGLFSKLKP